MCHTISSLFCHISVTFVSESDPVNGGKDVGRAGLHKYIT
jgi:hypothetical protein